MNDRAGIGPRVAYMHPRADHRLDTVTESEICTVWRAKGFSHLSAAWVQAWCRTVSGVNSVSTFPMGADTLRANLLRSRAPAERNPGELARTTEEMVVVQILTTVWKRSAKVVDGVEGAKKAAKMVGHYVEARVGGVMQACNVSPRDVVRVVRVVRSLLSKTMTQMQTARGWRGRADRSLRSCRVPGSVGYGCAGWYTRRGSRCVW